MLITKVIITLGGTIGTLLWTLYQFYYDQPDFEILSYKNLNPDSIYIQVIPPFNLEILNSLYSGMLYVKFNSHKLSIRAEKIEDGLWVLRLGNSDEYYLNKNNDENELQFSFNKNKYYCEPIKVKFSEKNKKRQIITDDGLPKSFKTRKYKLTGLVKIYSENELKQVLTIEEFQKNFTSSDYIVVYEKIDDNNEIYEIILRNRNNSFNNN
ncbi:MAG: hypothetical protein QXU40_02700 [Candidatus Pacearchaeota archaeon]